MPSWSLSALTPTYFHPKTKICGPFSLILLLDADLKMCYGITSVKCSLSHLGPVMLVIHLKPFYSPAFNTAIVPGGRLVLYTLPSPTSCDPSTFALDPILPCIKQSIQELSPLLLWWHFPCLLDHSPKHTIMEIKPILRKPCLPLSHIPAQLPFNFFAPLLSKTWKNRLWVITCLLPTVSSTYSNQASVFHNL